MNSTWKSKNSLVTSMSPLLLINVSKENGLNPEASVKFKCLGERCPEKDCW